MFKNLPLWADALLRAIAIIIILALIVFFSLVFLPSCSSEECNVSDWKYIGSATFSHLEYKPINLQSYTIYYMQNGKVYPVRRMQDGFETGQLVHIYRNWTVDGYKYKVFGDPVHKVEEEEK